MYVYVYFLFVSQLFRWITVQTPASCCKLWFWHEANNTPGKVSNETGLISAVTHRKWAIAGVAVLPLLNICHILSHIIQKTALHWSISFFWAQFSEWNPGLCANSSVCMFKCIQQPVSVRKCSVHGQKQDKNKRKKNFKWTNKEKHSMSESADLKT